MKLNLNAILAPFLPAMAVLVVSAPAAGSGDIVVAAQETTAVVSPRPAGLKLVNLPVLEFGLRAAFRCKGEPVSVTLSVADTHATVRQEKLAEKRSAEAKLQVPPRQLALAASTRFCVADDPETSNELLVAGLATAHASVRCAGEAGESVHFASAPLQVRLICGREPDADQVPSDER